MYFADVLKRSRQFDDSPWLKDKFYPILERFEKGHASNWYTLIMASAHGEKMPLPFHKRFDNIDGLCNYINEVLA